MAEALEGQCWGSLAQQARLHEQGGCGFVLADHSVCGRQVTQIWAVGPCCGEALGCCEEHGGMIARGEIYAATTTLRLN